MANDSNIHINDVGTVIEVTVYEDGAATDISTATLKKFHFDKPSDAELEVDAMFVTDGSNGKLKYTTQAGDIDETGLWKLQVYIEMGGGQWSSDLVYLTVLSNL